MLSNGVQFLNSLTIMSGTSCKTKCNRRREYWCLIWAAPFDFQHWWLTPSHIFFYIVFTGSRTWLGYLVKNITSLSVRYLQLAQIWYRPSFSIQSYFVKLPAQRSDDLTWKNTKRKKSNTRWTFFYVFRE